MKIVAFVGQSESGKTRLVCRLVVELKRRGLTVAVVKHCHSGFDFGGKEKDSSKFLAAGADGVALAAPEQTVVIRRRDREHALGALARDAFGTADIVLIEGGKSDVCLKKIEVLRQGLGRRPPDTVSGAGGCGFRLSCCLRPANLPSRQRDGDGRLAYDASGFRQRLQLTPRICVCIDRESGSLIHYSLQKGGFHASNAFSRMLNGHSIHDGGR